MGWIRLIVIGALAGWLAGRFMGDNGFVARLFTGRGLGRKSWS